VVEKFKKKIRNLAKLPGMPAKTVSNQSVAIIESILQHAVNDNCESSFSQHQSAGSQV